MKALFTARHSNALTTAQPSQFGVPFQQGELLSPSALEVLNGDGESLTFHAEVTMRWPDDSIRWLLVRTSAVESYQFGILETQNPRAQILIDEHNEFQQFSFCDNQVNYLAAEQALAIGKAAEIKLAFAANASVQNQRINKVSSKHFGGVMTCVEVDSFSPELGINLHQVFEFWHQQGVIKAEVGIHNPHRAKHPGGLWDLGDEGSRYFDSLELTVGTEEHGAPAAIQVNNEPEWLQGTKVCVYQASSGGNNWNSVNHVNHKNEVTLPFKGFEYRVANEQGETSKQVAGRANPLAKLGNLSLRQENFWQNFPSKIAASTQGITLSLFPATNEPHELQGGERKYQTAYLSMNGDDLAWAEKAQAVVLPAEYYEQSKAFPWFSTKPQDPRWRELLDQGIDGESNFFAKREIIDEFGWRNFGELYADHETLYQEEGENPYVSHYNNQYDPIYGFSRQFALTGDTRWFELMDDLAKHVVDIDIYHTEEDKIEYNNGLFWHTDHYLPAHTVTHRTFSKHNDTSSTPGQTGGGPAAEHCYSMGAMYHYLLTGSRRSKDSALTLANWLRNVHDDTHCVLQAVLSVKKHELTKFKKIRNGESVLAYRYPFTRGTGNYINSLIDAYTLNPTDEAVEHLYTVLRATMGPNDNIQARNLKDIEVGWHYLVLLSACIRLVDTLPPKHDEVSSYALACLKHYGLWMVNNEAPFLTDTTQLEFANDTWAAQDMRKAFVFSYLSETGLVPNRRGEEFLNYVLTHLSQSDTKHFSRIVVLLLQNQYSEFKELHEPLKIENSVSSKGQATVSSLIISSTKKLLVSISKTSVSKEKKWINARK